MRSSADLHSRSVSQVEAVMHDFVRLTEDPSMAMNETMEGDWGDLGSDDEVYNVQNTGESSEYLRGAGNGEPITCGLVP